MSLPEASHGRRSISTYPDDIVFSISIEDNYHYPPIRVLFGLRHAPAPYRNFIGACFREIDHLGSPIIFLDDPDYGL